MKTNNKVPQLQGMVTTNEGYYFQVIGHLALPILGECFIGAFNCGITVSFMPIPFDMVKSFVPFSLN